MVRMALIHARTSGPQKDYVEAVRWLRKAASQGDGVALMNLGKMHDEGVAVARLPRESARYVLSSLKAGAWVMLDQASRLSEETRREIQDQLRRAGYYSGPIDGLIGPETRAAMIEFARAGA
jgi:TPR repeat protein